MDYKLSSKSVKMYFLIQSVKKETCRCNLFTLSLKNDGLFQWKLDKWNSVQCLRFQLYTKNTFFLSHMQFASSIVQKLQPVHTGFISVVQICNLFPSSVSDTRHTIFNSICAWKPHCLFFPAPAHDSVDPLEPLWSITASIEKAEEKQHGFQTPELLNWAAWIVNHLIKICINLHTLSLSDIAS